MSWILGLLAGVLLVGCGPSHRLSVLEPDAVVLAFGDSLTYGTGVVETSSYPAVLSRLIGRTVIRSGVPGETSRLGLERLPRVLESSRPDLVILCHGGNDVLRRLPAADTVANLAEMIRLARERGAEVVLVAVPKFGIFPSAQPYYAEIAERFEVPVELDIVADLEADRSMKSDPIHFNEEGYRRMAEAVAALLRDAGAL